MVVWDKEMESIESIAGLGVQEVVDDRAMVIVLYHTQRSYAFRIYRSIHSWPASQTAEQVTSRGTFWEGNWIRMYRVEEDAATVAQKGVWKIPQ